MLFYPIVSKVSADISDTTVRHYNSKDVETVRKIHFSVTYIVGSLPRVRKLQVITFERYILQLQVKLN